MAQIAHEMRAGVEDQIAELKKEVARLSRSLSARANETAGDAGEALEAGTKRTLQVVRQMRDQAHVAADAARARPGTSALAAIGLVGLAAGLIYAASARR